MTVREPRWLGWGTDRDAEDGLGAAQAIGSLRRECPLQRRSMLVLHEAAFVRKLRNKVVTRFLSVLVLFLAQGCFLFLNRIEEGIVWNPLWKFET